jgi:hypothetical protein
MKAPYKFLAVLAVALITSTVGVRAQDGPPPPDAQYAQGDQGAPPPGQGDQGDDQGTSFQTFYDQLGDQGTWVQTDDYGYVFQPNVSDPNWAPYTDGHWVYTDQGWTWVSDEPWGWATYHYGRWANIDGTGWVWVPGYRWAPAWVSWRYGGGYCGWAPLPPDTFVGAEFGDSGVAIGIGFHFGGDVDTNYNIGPGCYNFVRVGDMGYRNYRGHFIDRSRNFTVINNTTNITNINVNRNGNNAGGTNFRGVAAGGPPINEINAHSRERIQNVNLVAANQPGRSNLQGNSLSVFAPSVNPATIHQARPSRVGQTLAHPTFNRGDSITKPLAVTSSLQPAAPSEAAIQEARTAQLHAPAKARIATEKTTIKTPLNKPLTSLAPVTQFHKSNATTSSTSGFNNPNAVTPNAQHSAASAPFTGEPVQHTQTFHPQNQVAPQTEVQHTQTFHPQNQVAPQTEVQHTQTFHPQNQVAPQTEVQHTQTYHPANNPPAQSFHPQTQVNHESTPPAHTQSAPANKPASGNANKNAENDKKKQQGQ